jgi:hypothetical protein
MLNLIDEYTRVPAGASGAVLEQCQGDRGVGR